MRGEVPRYWILLAPLLLIGLFAAVLVPSLPERSPLVGTWEAHGVVTGDTDPRSIQPRGTRFERVWEFTEKCTSRDCRLTLTRQALRRSETAPVWLAAGRLHATFELSTPGCPGAPRGTIRRYFDFDPAPGGRRLTATETTRAVYPSCGADGAEDVSVSSVRWTARKR